MIIPELAASGEIGGSIARLVGSVRFAAKQSFYTERLIGGAVVDRFPVRPTSRVVENHLLVSKAKCSNILFLPFPSGLQKPDCLITESISKGVFFRNCSGVEQSVFASIQLFRSQRTQDGVAPRVCPRVGGSVARESAEVVRPCIRAQDLRPLVLVVLVQGVRNSANPSQRPSSSQVLVENSTFEVGSWFSPTLITSGLVDGSIAELLTVFPGTERTG